MSTASRILIFLCIAVQTICNAQQGEVKILFVGDILLSRNVEQEIKFRGESPWRNLKSLFHSADIVIGNLEGSVGNCIDSSSSMSDSPLFTIHNDQIPLLRDAGFSIITNENNHSMDCGAEGKRATFEALSASACSPVDYSTSPFFTSVGGYSIAIVALNVIPGRNVTPATIPSVEVSRKLRLARSLASVVIVSIHWGSELLDWRNNSQKEIAEWLVRSGADVIIGSHPHVIQQLELIQGKPVFFSLGNHLFDQKYAATKEGLIAELTLHHDGMSIKGIKTHTSKNSFFPETTGTVEYKFGNFPIKNFPFHTQSYAVKAVSIIEQSGSKTRLEFSVNGRTAMKMRPKSLLYVSSTNFGSDKEYLFSIERHFSNLDGEIGVRPYVYELTQNEIVDRWRGSGLAWPLLDAQIAPFDSSILCGLHRGDSFVQLQKDNNNVRIQAYRWNGFGFSGVADSSLCDSCFNHFTRQYPFLFSRPGSSKGE